MRTTLNTFPTIDYEYQKPIKKIFTARNLWKPLINSLKEENGFRTLVYRTKSPFNLMEDASLRIDAWGFVVSTGIDSSLTVSCIAQHEVESDKTVNPYLAYCVLYAYFRADCLTDLLDLVHRKSRIRISKKKLTDEVIKFLYNFGNEHTNIILNQL